MDVLKINDDDDDDDVNKIVNHVEPIDRNDWSDSSVSLKAISTRWHSALKLLISQSSSSSIIKFHLADYNSYINIVIRTLNLTTGYIIVPADISAWLG